MVETFHDAEVREPAIQIAGRFLGIVVFLVGIAMLGLAFSLAYQAFQNTDLLIPTALMQKDPPPPLLTAVVIPVILKLVLLFAMGYIGSLIAARGAYLFFSAKREVRRAITGD